MQHRPLFYQLIYLVQSRRRQAEVFGPEAVLLMMAAGFLLGRLLGDSDASGQAFAWFALAPAGVAAFSLWRLLRHQPVLSPLLGVIVLLGGITVVLPPLMLLSGLDLGLVWAAAAVIFALAGLFRLSHD
ncbi:MAG: hypothetical protein SF029_17080 [bacterium]|nr:hypothetical protein [bacterium]